MRSNDRLQRFLFEKHNIRGEIVHLDATYHAIKDIHPYPQPVQKLLGQALAAVSLLSATLKYQGSLILQTNGSGPVDPLVVQCTDTLHLRGMAKYPEALTTSENLLGEGQLAITIIPDNGKNRYQGIVNLIDDNLANSLEHYFLQSEQLLTKIWLFATEQSAHGIFLQQMPNKVPASQDIWDELCTLTETITLTELMKLSNKDLLHRLFHEHDVRLFDPTPTCFRCSCNIEKMEQAILTLGKSAAEDTLKTHKTISVTCEFCNQHYEFDKVDVAQLFI